VVITGRGGWLTGLSGCGRGVVWIGPGAACSSLAGCFGRDFCYGI